MGFSQENGTNVRFCRSMEVFLNDKSKRKNNRCVFNDDYLWRFDDVMIDELDKSQRRLSVRKENTCNKDSIH